MESLQDRDLRIIGVEGYDDAWTNINAWGRPPLLGTAKIDRSVIVPDDDEPAPPEPPPPSSLLIAELRAVGPVDRVRAWRRDGAGRGGFGGGGDRRRIDPHLRHAARPRDRGFTGRSDARIFARRMDAELLAIDGVYKTADDLDAAYRNKPAQAWLDGQTLRLGAQ